MTNPGAGSPLLEARSLSRRFGQVRALQDVSAAFAAGEIHAVLGENGAGKSTLMEILAGFLSPDSGEVLFEGRALPVGRPSARRKLGIEMIHQHFTLVPEFTVEENLALARLPGLASPIRVSRVAAPALEVAQGLGWSFEGRALVGGISVGVQQRLEIVKALAGAARVLILDEPSAVLTPGEVDDLFRVLRRLRDEGRAVILIAHKLAEVLAVADRVTVLRRGRFVASAPIGEVDADRLATWMVGEMPPLLARSETRKGLVAGLVVEGLEVKGDRGEPAVRGVSFEIKKGEIAGFGGVDGNGQVELAEALAGIRRPARGTVRFAGREAYRAAYIPQDRQDDGLALSMSIADNLLIEGHRRPELGWGPFLWPRASREWVDGLVDRYEIKVGAAWDAAATLSGGNQQKVVVSRALEADPDLLVAVNPTRGLDIRATEYVQRQIVAARDRGVAVALISTDLDELAALAGRTVFLSRGALLEGKAAADFLGGQA